MSIREKAKHLFSSDHKAYRRWVSTLEIKEVGYIVHACTWWYSVTDPAEPFSFALAQSRHESPLLDLIYGGAA